VLIALSKPDGSYQPPASLGLQGIAPTSIAVADFNGDGKLDLALTDDASSQSVVVLLGNGDGSFQPPAAYRAGQDLKWLAGPRRLERSLSGRVRNGVRSECEGRGIYSAFYCKFVLYADGTYVSRAGAG
jgi:FG-GAP-like repeat